MKKARLLIGENDASTRSVMRELLDSEYDVVAVAEDGKEALESARAHRPEVVLLDIGLPVLSGIAVARRLKKALPVTRIIFVTTHADIDYIREAFRIGVDGYVVKSSIAQELIPAVENVLEGRRYSPAAGLRD
jgi:DNA-binding NarL/FixJ family response regulator